MGGNASPTTAEDMSAWEITTRAREAMRSVDSLHIEQDLALNTGDVTLDMTGFCDLDGVMADPASFIDPAGAITKGGSITVDGEVTMHVDPEEFYPRLARVRRR